MLEHIDVKYSVEKSLLIGYSYKVSARRLAITTETDCYIEEEH